MDRWRLPPSLRGSLPRRGLTLGLAVLGTLAFWWADLPLPFLFGPMAACLLASLAGAPLSGLDNVSKASRTILGVAIGSSITPEVVHQLPRMAVSLAFVPLYIAVLGGAGVVYFRRVCGFDFATSYFSAMPGGLTDMVVFGQEAGADIRALSLIHATRVFIILVLAPLILIKGFGVGLSNPIGESTSNLPLIELFLMAAAALVGWKVAERVGLFGGTILGPLIAALVLSLTGLIQHRPPSEAILTAQFFIGMTIGVGYVGVTLIELRKDVLAGVFHVLILALLAAGMTEMINLMGLAPPLDAFLAFAPGGQAEMALLAILAGADLGFVVVHHLARMVIVVTGAPLVARLFHFDDRK